MTVRAFPLSQSPQDQACGEGLDLLILGFPLQELRYSLHGLLMAQVVLVEKLQCDLSGKGPAALGMVLHDGSERAEDTESTRGVEAPKGTRGF